MNFLYHQVPSEMRGNILFPLNQLKEIHPDLYLKEVEKYIGREWILDERIPPLECFWNDVLFLSAIHPYTLVHQLRKVGLPIKPRWQFFVIDPVKLDPSLLTVFLYSGNGRDYEEFQKENLSRYAIIPEKTKQYFRQEAARGQRPLLYHHIPHILYRGPIQAAGLEIIKA